ncbi:aminotransferase class-III [Actinobacteria bacterium OK074]|nr:aminotransferase class-III [Actinobacteria bacterium OK074]
MRQICDAYGILLITDEVMTGFGRTGTWFAVQNWAVVPDLLTFVKGVTSGYVPLGGALISESVNRIMAVCRNRGVWPFVNTNRVHGVPPPNITEAELREGPAVLDEALSVADDRTRCRTR